MHLSTYIIIIGFLLFCPNQTVLTDSVCDVSSLPNFLQFMRNLLNEVLEVSAKYGEVCPGPKDCAAVQKAGNTKSGIYRIWPLNWNTYGSFPVYCDMETDGGGWTVIQRRGNYGKPQDYFYKTWKEYQMGFGNLNEDFWLGNDKIFSLTNQGNYSIRIDMKDKEGEKRFAVYQQFWIENEKQLYTVYLSEYSGDAGDAFNGVSGMKFTTKDSDNDIHGESNCAQHYKGGWWYIKCHCSNLNGLYLDGPHESFTDGIEWGSWKGQQYSLPEVDMKIRIL